MKNYLLTLSFDGSRYHGWQLQHNAVTVQQRLSEAARSLFGDTTVIQGCSRTDAGVHANMFCCSFFSDTSIPVERLPAAFNAKLPRDIAVSGARHVSDAFHARYSCIGKEYIYKLYTGKYRNPFYDGYALHYPHSVPLDVLNTAAAAFIGTHDFKGFCSTGSDVASTVRTVNTAYLEQSGDIVTFHIAANGFLYNMVRIITGTLLYIAQGKLDCSSMTEIIESGDRMSAGPTAPAHGLYLNRVFY